MDKIDVSVSGRGFFKKILKQVLLKIFFWKTSHQKIISKVTNSGVGFGKVLIQLILKPSWQTQTCLVDNDWYAELKWMKVRQRAEFFKNILMYKCVNGLAPDYLSNGIQSQMITHSYNTRSSTGNSITQSAIRTEFGKCSFKFSGARSWNDLPCTIKILPNLQI